jgi:hypothetical protein
MDLIVSEPFYEIATLILFASVVGRALCFVSPSLLPSLAWAS